MRLGVVVVVIGCAFPVGRVTRSKHNTRFRGEYPLCNIVRTSRALQSDSLER